MEVRKRQGLCFHCDEAYHIAHKCKHLFVILGEECDEIEDAKKEEIYVGNEQEFHISIHALAGHVTPDTIKLLGRSKGHHLSILIDSGSTHSFLDPSAAKQDGCELEYTNPLLVIMADGGRICCNAKCREFQWEMGSQKFKAEVRLLRLDGCDMVIGVDFLRRLVPVTFDFDKQCLYFLKEAESKLEGCKPAPELEPLLEKYKDIFQVPKSLPSHRSHDHKIPLEEGVKPFKQKPYRYPYIQKIEIEKLEIEMLEIGIIQASNNPFSSPVLLVKKKDGAWRFCIDSRKLNSLTIKDNVPIPLIDDLLGELGSACIFSRIDLRAGYHQIDCTPDTFQKLHSLLFLGYMDSK
ncbi:UNVERIFIED_CONTAM: Transposon Ty3-G Gag-Pol polyprotein [Sesamum latifolium]|uniref:Transposon Ty3-G Gag-Pol polyprotein n=1 Tax=Sesamum latifolium TaxID=2727402 RepID=A0AAW2XNP5_9LAMI